MTEDTNILPPIQKAPLTRNSFGLIEGVDYKFSGGFISWRDMINPEFLYPNKDAFKGEPVPESIEGLEDHQLLCKLGGYKELARLRGFKSVSYDLTHITNEHVSAICTIEWIGNYETDNEPVKFASTANASPANLSGFGVKFPETIAENRAFVRAVRNFLNIHIVGGDEIDKSSDKKSEPEPAKANPIPNLQNKLREKIVSSGCEDKASFQAKLKDLAEKTGKFEYKDWERCADIPIKECRIILGLLDKEVA